MASGTVAMQIHATSTLQIHDVTMLQHYGVAALLQQASRKHCNIVATHVAMALLQ
jgi:hypothetical protein